MKPSRLVILLALAGSGCATHPEQVPSIDLANLPKLELAGLKPKTMEVVVNNNRPVNKKAGNSTDVEKAIGTSLVDAITRGGIKVGSSRNRLAVTIEDCPDAPEGAECVKMLGKLTTAGLTIDIESTSSQGYQKGTHIQYGDISQAYQGGLQLMIRSLMSKYREYYSR